MELISAFLAQFEKQLDSKAIELYNENFLISVRVATRNNYHYFRGHCSAEMKKSLVYTVDIIIDNNGVLVETQCECGVRMGPDAHCEHVCCILYGLNNFTSTKTLKLKATCTEKLQTFHQSKKFKGSPVKAEDLRLKNDPTTGSISMLKSLTPQPQDFRNDVNYPEYFRNLCINFASSEYDPMPIVHRYPPCNLCGLHNDHQYSKCSAEEMFLEQHCLHEVSKEAVQEIEASTRKQAASVQWYAVREVRLTASKFGEICKASSKCDFEMMARGLSNQKKFFSYATNHGLKYESIAIKRLKEDLGIVTSKCGTFISISKPFLCGTPDCVVDDTTIEEVKCPFSAKDKPISTTTVPYLKEVSKGFKLDSNHNYYNQIQG